MDGVDLDLAQLREEVAQFLREQALLREEVDQLRREQALLRHGQRRMREDLAAVMGDHVRAVSVIFSLWSWFLVLFAPPAAAWLVAVGVPIGWAGSVGLLGASLTLLATQRLLRRAVAEWRSRW